MKQVETSIICLMYHPLKSYKQNFHSNVYNFSITNFSCLILLFSPVFDLSLWLTHDFPLIFPYKKGKETCLGHIFLSVKSLKKVNIRKEFKRDTTNEGAYLFCRILHLHHHYCCYYHHHHDDKTWNNPRKHDDTQKCEKLVTCLA